MLISNKPWFEEFCLFGYDAMQSVESQVTFQRKMLPHIQQNLLSASHCFLAWLIFIPGDRGDMLFLRNIW
jgi:hypothetical protein